jgi:hypothetical protein
MATIALDTYKIITKLQQKGFTKDQAEALVSAAQDIDLSEIATKSDLKIALYELKIDLLKWMSGMMLAQGALIVALIQYFK